MDAGILSQAIQAFSIVLDPFRLLMLSGGVFAGLLLGIIPGIGGLSGMALLLPFTFVMDPYTAFAVLLGMYAVTGTSDTIPAVMFGVPGTSGAQATIMDGHVMARKGEAGRALSAAYMSSLIGGLVGAALLAFFIPVLRPIVLLVGSPELMALTLLGIAMVAVLSGNAPLRGLIAGGLGLMFSMTGMDPQTGTLRWTMGRLYLWDGLPIIPVMLGLFAVPALADLAINRRSIAGDNKIDASAGTRLGIRDALQNWWLIVRCGGIGAAIGAIPGLSSSVVDWIAYSHAAQTEKGASETFGKGDVRGVIAPESANNSIASGVLVPTVAFGVPGSGAMAILLTVFLMHGLQPGPDMLTENLDITYSMVWSIALANILGAGICLIFSGQLAKFAQLRHTLILPAVLVVVFVGAYQASRQWGDLYTLLAFAVLGWTMKQLKWPRPPLVLGFVLGSILERYMFISIQRYGMDWLFRPGVVIVLVVAAFIILAPLVGHWRNLGGMHSISRNMRRLQFHPSGLMHIGVGALVIWMLAQASSYPQAARVVPLTIGLIVVGMCIVSLLNQLIIEPAPKHVEQITLRRSAGIHMDDVSERGAQTTRQYITRAGVFLAFFLAFMVSVALVGFLLTAPLLVIAYMRIEGREKWPLTLIYAAVVALVVFGIFDQLLSLPWPPTMLGQWVPPLTVIPSV